MNSSHYEVVIIGAGLAGLRLLSELQCAGIRSLIIEKSDQPGGRVKTIEKEGFLLDLGFQVLLDSYDELDKSITIEKLDLSSFDSGAILVNNGTKKHLFNPLKHPEKILNTLFGYPGKFSDMVRILRMAYRSVFSKNDFYARKDSVSTRQFLLQQGFSQEIIDSFFTPFFGGVFLDPQLEVSANYFLWLLDKFRVGNACLPKLGMGQIAKSMTTTSGEILFGEEATSIVNNTILLKSGKEIEAKWIVNATGKEDVVFGGYVKNDNEFRSATTVYLKGPKLTTSLKSLVLVGNPESSILHFSFPSEIQKNYAPEGFSLCSVSLKWSGLNLDPLELTEKILKELSLEYPDISWSGYSYLAHFDIPYALPKWTTGNESTFTVLDHRIVIGDHVAYPSINGALKSGREAGEFLRKQIQAGM